MMGSEKRASTAASGSTATVLSPANLLAHGGCYTPAFLEVPMDPESVISASPLSADHVFFHQLSPSPYPIAAGTTNY